MLWMCIRIASVSGKILKIIQFIILIPTPDFPHFYYMLGGNLGSLLYGDVSVMIYHLQVGGTNNCVFIVPVG